MATKRKPKRPRPASRARRPAKRAAPRRPKRKQPESSRARTLSAVLTVGDIQRSLGWYQGALGFTVEDRWEFDGMLQGVDLKAGNARLSLSQDDWAKGRDRVKGVGMRLYFSTVQDLDKLAAGIMARGGTLDYEPKLQPWGDRTFAVTDPDGFHLTFAQRKR